ncbi:polysaccharide deacetylase family protein [Paenarthrobacter sp. AR 02]|uniref:polysaccharide deacetylase family protein n=1 Tax=Paenarthrobacter sp. AR 02 TaxID=2899821 RepID=UPI001F23A828|nr:polysaccharide deacetylase family protein [Paenarthrobacter sp. AR 02]MCF3140687.1 polysaccharide deacetylase family protein [Paenarthrobacter sp. AR 02]
MTGDHSAMPFSMPSRRVLLGLVGASVAAGLTACTPGEGAESTTTALTPDAAVGSPEVPAAPGAPTATPTATKRIRRSFIPDYQLPPIVGGLAPVITKIPTKHPIVFLTIDDGNIKTPESVTLMAEYDYPASLFLTKNTIADNPAFFNAFKAQGSLVENHTVTHNINMVRQWGYQQQLNDIVGMQEYAVQQYGRKPTLFRPPGGAYSNAMRQAVAAAGLKAVVTWEAKANAGKMDYQVGDSLRPGDIVLMHFRAEFAADLAAFRAAQLAAGLEVVLLEDFLGVA